MSNATNRWLAVLLCALSLAGIALLSGCGTQDPGKPVNDPSAGGGASTTAPSTPNAEGKKRGGIAPPPP